MVNDRCLHILPFFLAFYAQRISSQKPFPCFLPLTIVTTVRSTCSVTTMQTFMFFTIKPFRQLWASRMLTRFHWFSWHSNFLPSMYMAVERSTKPPPRHKKRTKGYFPQFLFLHYNNNILFSVCQSHVCLIKTESFKRYRLPTNISASIVKVFSFLKSISVLSTWKSSGVMSAKILISSNGISYDSETLFW